MTDEFNLKNFLQDAIAHGVTTCEIADEGSFSKGSVDRWSEGRSNPHPSGLPYIKRLVEQLKSLKGDFNFASFVNESLAKEASKEAIIEKFGINETTLQRWATGQNEPQAFTVLKVVQFIKELTPDS